MGLKGLRTLTITDASGAIITAEADDRVAIRTTVSATCDSAKCVLRHNCATPVVVQWVEEEVQDHPELLPDAYFGLIKMAIIDPPRIKELVFCSPQCVKDYFTYEYVTPRTYQAQKEELDEIAAKHKEYLDAQKAPIEDQIKNSIICHDGLPSAEDLDAMARLPIPGVTASVES